MNNSIGKGVFERFEYEKRKITSNTAKEKSSESDALSSERALGEIENLLKAIWTGSLDARADVSGASCEDREMLEGINELLDAGIGPLGIAVIYLDKILKSAKH